MKSLASGALTSENRSNSQPGAAAFSSGGVDVGEIAHPAGDDVQGDRGVGLLRRRPQYVVVRVPVGRAALRRQRVDHHAAQALLADAVDFGRRPLRIVGGDRGDTEQAVGVARAELGMPVVEDLHRAANHVAIFGQVGRVHHHRDQGGVDHLGLDAGFVEEGEPPRRVVRHRRIDALAALLLVDAADLHHLVAGEEERALPAGMLLHDARREVAEAVVQAAGVDLVGLDDVGIGGDDAFESLGHGTRRDGSGRDGGGGAGAAGAAPAAWLSAC